MVRNAMVFGLALVCGVAARAEVSPVYTSCVADAHGEQDARDKCTLAELNRQDARMTAAYERVMKHMRDGDPGQDRFTAQQKDWVKGREKQCGMDTACKLNLTVQRVEFLEKDKRPPVN